MRAQERPAKVVSPPVVKGNPIGRAQAQRLEARLEREAQQLLSKFHDGGDGGGEAWLGNAGVTYGAAKVGGKSYSAAMLATSGGVGGSLPQGPSGTGSW